MTTYTPKSLLNLLVTCHNIINFMENHLEDHLAASTSALPNPPKEVKKEIEDWVYFINNGIEKREEDESLDSDKLN